MHRFYRTASALIFIAAMALWGCASAPTSIRVDSFIPPLADSVEPFPFPVIRLRGSSQQLGEQHALQLSPAIHTLYDQYLVPFIGSPTRRFIALSAANLFETKLKAEHREELHALADGTHEDERETMLGQCFLDLSQLSGCSTIALPAAASPDHIARFGRNLDFWSLNIADKYTTLFLVHPDDGRYAYAAIGWPGMIGLLSGMNQHGLCLASMEVPRSPRFPTAMPYTLLYRTVLEHCKNVQEAIDMLQQTPRQTANNLMLMDAGGARAVVELSPAWVHIRQSGQTSALISTNHQRDQDTTTRGLCPRYDYLRDASETDFGQIDRNEMQTMLSHVGNHSTLQSMIFEPATRGLYLAAGQSAASKHFYRFDLRHFFDEN